MHQWPSLKQDQVALLLVDYQERLLPVMDDPGVVKVASQLTQVAMELKLPVFYSEQYPKGLGATVEPLRQQLEEAQAKGFAKVKFNAFADDLREAVRLSGKRQILLAGIESHICLWQTAEALVAEGYEVFVVADGCSSRQARHVEWALESLRAHGVQVESAETLLYRLLGSADAAAFKPVAKLLR